MSEGFDFNCQKFNTSFSDHIISAQNLRENTCQCSWNKSEFIITYRMLHYTRVSVKCIGLLSIQLKSSTIRLEKHQNGFACPLPADLSLAWPAWKQQSAVERTHLRGTLVNLGNEGVWRCLDMENTPRTADEQPSHCTEICPKCVVSHVEQPWMTARF